MTTPSVYTDLDVINMSLESMGETEISSLADESKRARIMARRYPLTREAALTKTAWGFATAKASLSLLSGAPLSKWAAAWQLPVDNLKVLNDWPPSQYAIVGNRLYTNATQSVIIDYIRLVLEPEWPAWFVNFVVWQLHEDTVKGITGSSIEADDRSSLEKAYTDALAADGQQQPNVTDQPNPFIDCRF